MSSALERDSGTRIDPQRAESARMLHLPASCDSGDRIDPRRARWAPGGLRARAEESPVATRIRKG